MKSLIKAALLIAVIRWGAETFTSYRLELPSGQRLMDCLGEVAEAVSDLLQEIRIVPQNSESCLYFSGS